MMKHAIAVFAIVAGMSLPVFAASVAPAQVSAQVVDSRSNAPIGGVRVTAYPEGSSKAESSAISDAKGRFTLRGLHGGDYRLLFERDGYGKALAGGVSVAKGSHLILVAAFALRATGIDSSQRLVDSCGSLVQPGQTADVYVICSGH